MKAVRMVGPGRPLELQQIPAPEPRPGEVRVAIRAAGICHSDAHYRAGIAPMGPLPLTLGHEIAGVVEKLGPGVSTHAIGDRVCLHYFTSCGRCAECSAGHEQFCEHYAMLGHHRDGGFAEYVTAPARNAVFLPDRIAFEHGAILMCSSATSLHALARARLAPGETVAVFGCGGLGMSAIQLARALGAREVFGVDIRAEPLSAVRKHGAIPVDASAGDPVAALRHLTNQRGVDVALELAGLPATMRQALQALAPLGRVVLVGISNRALEIDPYREVIGREAELIGCNDHHLDELHELLALAQSGGLDLGSAITRRVPLEADAINAVLDDLDRFEAGTRAVVVP